MAQNVFDPTQWRWHKKDKCLIMNVVVKTSNLRLIYRRKAHEKILHFCREWKMFS